MDRGPSFRNVLARGLNFAIAPSVLPKEEFVTAIEKASRGMEPDEGRFLEMRFLAHYVRPNVPSLT